MLRRCCTKKLAVQIARDTKAIKSAFARVQCLSGSYGGRQLRRCWTTQSLLQISSPLNDDTGHTVAKIIVEYILKGSGTEAQLFGFVLVLSKMLRPHLLPKKQQLKIWRMQLGVWCEQV